MSHTIAVAVIQSRYGLHGSVGLENGGEVAVVVIVSVVLPEVLPAVVFAGFIVHVAPVSEDGMEQA